MLRCRGDVLRVRRIGSSVGVLVACFVIAPGSIASPIATVESVNSAISTADPKLDAALPGAIVGAFGDSGDVTARMSGDASVEAAPATTGAPALEDGDNAPRGSRLSPNSLRSVLRSIATIDRPSRRRAPASAPQPVDGDYFDPFELVLESDVAGDALRAVLDVKATDGQFTIFSVFGMGEFVLELETTTHSAIVYELSSGWSAGLATTRENGQLLGYSAELTRASEYGLSPRQPINYVKLVWDWIRTALTTPLGMIAAMMIVIVLSTWMFRRALSVLQRRAVGARR
jgi:hypothetical protein